VPDQSLMIGTRALLAIGVLVSVKPPEPLSAQASLRPDDFIIAGVRDGLDSASVRRILGAPDSVSFTIDPGAPGHQIAHWNYRRFSVVLTAHVLGINVLQRGVRTHRGLRVGDSLNRVRQLYGPPDEQDGTDWWYRDPNNSTASHVMLIDTMGGRVTSIYLGWYTD
jgi:hypothetical protein